MTHTMREQIEQELERDPNRSDRAIARLVGVDHKTVGNIRRTVGNAIRQNGELGNSPDASGETVGSAPDASGECGGEIDDGDKSDDRFSWGDVPEDAVVIRPQGLTAAFIEEKSGDLIIAQDRTHLWYDDAVIRINATEVDDFVRGLVDMVKENR